MLHLLMTNKAFINFRPCVLHEMKAGAMARHWCAPDATTRLEVGRF